MCLLTLPLTILMIVITCASTHWTIHFEKIQLHFFGLSKTKLLHFKLLKLPFSNMLPVTKTCMRSLLSMPRNAASFRLLNTKSSQSDYAEPRNPDNSKCINKVVLLGRCVGDPIMKPLNNNNFSTFIMVTNEIRKTRSNELVKRSDFHKVYVYQPFLAKKVFNLITKGTRVYLEGKLNYRKYENQFFSNIVAEKLIFISGTNQNFEASGADESHLIEEIDESFLNENAEDKQASHY